MTTDRKRDIQHFRDLEVYQRAFKAAMEIFQITKRFPPEEKYSMIDQMRRSSRSVCSIGMLISMEQKSDKFCY